MRSLVVLLSLVLLTPAAAAASQVHVTFLGTEYAVTYVSNATGELATMRVASDAGSYEVEGRSFPLARPPLPNESTRVVFVADIGTDRNATAIVRAIVAEEPSLVLIGGDLAYAHGDVDLWDKFFTILEPLASRVPVMPAYGNHEGYCEEEDGGFETCEEERERYDAFFELPNDDELYYAFDWGPMRFTVLDTEAYVEGPDHPTAEEEQAEFLNASLANDSERWDVVMYHRPLRTTNSHAGASVGDQREHLEHLLDGHAQLVLQAHVHAYERSHETENGTLFVTSGGGGRNTYAEWEEMQPWVAARAAEHHYVLLDVSPTRIEGRAVLLDGGTLDAFSLEKPAPPPPTRPVSPSVSASPTPPVTPTASTLANVTSPTSTTSASPNGGNGSVDEANTPMPAALALVAVLLLMLSKRRPGRPSPAGARPSAPAGASRAPPS